jgi:hypothetical protein
LSAQVDFEVIRPPAEDFLEESDFIFSSGETTSRNLALAFCHLLGSA